VVDGVRTTCPYCGVGCGVIATPQPDGSVAIKGDTDHPANFGRLCSKGSALGETVGVEDRLLHPEIHGHRANWDSALDLVAKKFSEAIAAHGPDSVAFYVSGQLLTEDYYVANKLMKGFIGSANIDTNSRLCMASSVAGHRRAFGSDTVPGTYEDLELADLVVLTGSNLAWCHPVLYQRLAAAKEKRPEIRVVVIDPRRTMTADIADLHLAIAPDGDTALFAGLLRYLAEKGIVRSAYVEKHTNGFNDALAAAHSFTPQRVAMETGLAAEEIESFYRLFAGHERAVTVYSQGVNQSASGTDKVNAIINCHLATGRIGRPGMGPFSVTGQPNAMGGREVGGLANMLACHMDIENGYHRDLVQRFWHAPRMAEKPGLKAVDMFRAVAEGRIKALWIMATNPADSLPDADAVEAALKVCPFVVVSDIASATDTLRHAHVKLPSAGWGEKDGTVTNSERRISRQRPFLSPPGEARADWWQLAEVAKRMGFAEAFDYSNPAEIFREYAALSAEENDGSRDFDIGAHAAIEPAEFDALQPFQWPALAKGTPEGDDFRFFASGNFYTPDRRARFIAVKPEPRRVIDGEYPFVLNTGRVRDHWHTMTRTGKSARLSAHMAEPFAEIRTRGEPPRHGHRPRARDASPTAGLRLRADALDRPVCGAGQGGCACGAPHRSLLRSARLEERCRARHSIRACVLRLCGERRAPGTTGPRLLGFGPRGRRLAARARAWRSLGRTGGAAAPPPAACRSRGNHRLSRRAPWRSSAGRVRGRPPRRRAPSLAAPGRAVAQLCGRPTGEIARRYPRALPGRRRQGGRGPAGHRRHRLCLLRRWGKPDRDCGPGRLHERGCDRQDPIGRHELRRMPLGDPGDRGGEPGGCGGGVVRME
jgi:assimilatory nitrate reductase catalytic subunit